MPQRAPIEVGVISDTHGLVRPEALDALAGVDLIVHAGDVGGQAVLDLLADIAPLHAVRGNVDVGPWADALPETLTVEVGNARLYVLHDVNTLDLDPHTAGIDVVVSGHSHRPRLVTENGVLYFNPASAGPRRFSLPISLGRLTIRGHTVDARHIPLLP